MLPGKTGTPPSKIEYPPLKTLSPGSQKAEEFLKEWRKNILKNKDLTSLYNLDLIIIIHEIHSRS
jgi:hypothetical protein